MDIKFTDNSKEILAAMQKAAVRALEKCGKGGRAAVIIAAISKINATE